MTRLPLLRFALPVSLAAFVAATPAVAQAPPPPPSSAAPPAPGFPPPTSPGAPGTSAPPPGAVRPPPPPPPGGPSVILDHNGEFAHVDVHCAPTETTQACGDLAARLYDRLNGAVQAK